MLDLDPENAQAYLGKLMAELRVQTKNVIQQCKHSFEQSDNYKKTIRFADQKLKEEINSYLKIVKERIKKEEEYHRQQLYNKWIALIENTTEISSLLSYKKELSNMTTFKDAKNLADKCIERIYTLGKNIMNNARLEADYRYAAEIFYSILDYRDSKQLEKVCENRAQETVDRKIKDKQIDDLQNKINIMHEAIVKEEKKGIFKSKKNIEFYENEIRKLNNKIKELE